MIYLNMSSVLYRCDPANAALYDERSRLCASDILAYHFKPDMRCTLENVGPQGEVRDHVTEGRVVNPGHDIECSWFLMEYAARIGDAPLCKARGTCSISPWRPAGTRNMAVCCILSTASACPRRHASTI